MVVMVVRLARAVRGRLWVVTVMTGLKLPRAVRERERERDLQQHFKLNVSAQFPGDMKTYVLVWRWRSGSSQLVACGDRNPNRK